MGSARPASTPRAWWCGPWRMGLQPRVKDGRFRFRLRQPCQLSIEPGGSLRHPLHLFANPLEKDVPDPNDPKVRYYGPGYHEVGEIELLSGETVYIAGGAMVSLKPQPAEKLAANSRHQNYGVDVWWSRRPVRRATGRSR